MALTDRNHEDYFQEMANQETSFAEELIQDEARQQYFTFIEGLRNAEGSFNHDKLQYENGYISAIDLAVKLTEEKDILEAQAKLRKDLLNEISEEITTQAEQYGKQGYKGRIFSKQYKTTYSFNHIPEWQKFNTDRKAFEEKSKLALKMVEKGGLNVDEDGAEIPLPEVKISSYLKTEYAK